MRRLQLLAALCVMAAAGVLHAQATQPATPPVTEGDFIARNVTFRSGETMAEVRLHYRTLGTPQRNAAGRVTNAVWIGHGTGGSGSQFLSRNFAGQLFGPGQPLDATKYFIVLPDHIGHGGSSKPSNGLRAQFPRYGYRDMVDLQYRLLTEGLQINHMRLVMGTSMGGMHSWLWGQMYPDYMDALMPLASVPAQMLWLMSSNPVRRHAEAPTLADADRVMEQYVANYIKTSDANDVLYYFEASRDYDPAPGLEKIVAPLVAVNSADDIINPPEIEILEKEITRVRRGRAVVIPLSDRTAGHGTHTMAAVWSDELVRLLRESEPVRRP